MHGLSARIGPSDGDVGLDFVQVGAAIGGHPRPDSLADVDFSTAVRDKPERMGRGRRGRQVFSSVLLLIVCKHSSYGGRIISAA